MKKSRFFIIITLLIAFLIIILGLLYYFTSNLSTFELSPEICQIVTGKTSYDFQNSHGKNTTIKFGYTFSKLDNKENLILIMTDRQIELWKKSYYTEDFIYLSQNESVIVSEDFSEVIVKCNNENASKELVAGGVIVRECVFKQVLEKKSSDDIKVNFKVFDEKTGILKYKANFPQEEIDFNIGDLNLSSSET